MVLHGQRLRAALLGCGSNVLNKHFWSFSALRLSFPHLFRRCVGSLQCARAHRMQRGSLIWVEPHLRTAILAHMRATSCHIFYPRTRFILRSPLACPFLCIIPLHVCPPPLYSRLPSPLARSWKQRSREASSRRPTPSAAAPLPRPVHLHTPPRTTAPLAAAPPVAGGGAAQVSTEARPRPARAASLAPPA